MNNQDFVKTFDVDEKTQQKCLAAMEKYGDNHWWEPDVDPRTLAYYQMLEPVMLVANFSRFHQAIELLLGRPVWTHEFGIAADALKQEVERAWNAPKSITEESRQQAVAQSFKELADFAEKHNKTVIVAELGENRC